MKKFLLKIAQIKKCQFIENQTGNVLIAFAIMVPVIFAFFAISINNAQVLKARALVSEATNEASLAVVAINNKNETNQSILDNESISLSYMNYYLKKEIKDELDGATIAVNYNDTDKEYYVSYRHNIKPMLSINMIDNSNQSLSITNRQDGYGNTRKQNIAQSVDIGFIADFSGSITCDYANTTCNSYTNVAGNQRRLDYMRTALGELISTYETLSQFKFAFIPYDIGVPVLNDKKNLANGEAYSCSVLYSLKTPYDKLDYDFWANKNIFYKKWQSLKKSNVINDYLTYDYFNKYSNIVYYYLDYYNYLYYSKIIGPAFNHNTNKALVDSGLCTKKYAVDNVNLGAYKYACGSTLDDYPLSKNNRSKVENEYAAMVKLYDFMYSGDFNTHYSLANTETVNIKKTIETLFSDMNKNVITFTRPIAPAMAEYSPFSAMCQSPIFSNRIMVGGDDKLTEDQIHNNASNNIKSFKASPHLVPLGNNSTELASYLKSNQWTPGGGTDTMTALLRTVPVMAEGTSKNKLLIIISDGKDDSGADTLRDSFLDQGVCQTITSGLTSTDFEQKGFIAKAAKSAAIHYIKLDPSAQHLDENSSDSQYEAVYGKWFTKCMNKDKQYLHVATNYDSLLNIATFIIQTETGVFVPNNK